MKIFASNKTDNKVGFYRIIQPLRMLKRSGWEARTIPFTGKNDISVLPIHDELLVRLSKDTDFILTSIVLEEKEILRIMDLRKLNNCKWVVDVSDNIYTDPALKQFVPIIEKSIMAADGLITTNQANKDLYQRLNENVYILPSCLDFKLWDHLKSRPKKIGYFGMKEDLEIISPVLKELVKEHKVEFVNMFVDGVIGAPEQIAKKNISIALFPLADNEYNHYKDNIDLKEALALKIPVVASPIYKDLPVLYANSNFQWYEIIEKLIKDTTFRKEIGQKGYEFVKSNFDMTKFVGNLQRWLKELPRKDY